MKMEAQIRLINLDDIISNKFQLRLSVDDNSLDNLVLAIESHGIFQPLLVRRFNDKYELIMGERKLKAAKKAGLQAIPCIITDISDTESAEINLIENTHRRNLNPIETAEAYKNLLDKKYLGQEQLAKRLGVSFPEFSNKVRLLTLDLAVQNALKENQITEEHAKVLLRLTDKMKQVELLNRLIAERWTAKQLEEIVVAVVNSYNSKYEDQTGAMKANNRFDAQIDKIIKNSTDIVSDVDFGDNIDNYYYSYNSNLNKAKDTSENKKSSLFFNNLENESANMDPTLNFGFNPFKNDFKIDEDEEDDDFDLLDDDDSPVKSPQVEQVIVEPDLEKNEDVIAQIKKIMNKSKANGLAVKFEEFDFDNMEQFIIRIDKEDKK